MKSERSAQTWSIIIFGLNERETLGRVVEQAYQVLRRMGAPAYEVIVVDDGSTDGSVELARELGRVNDTIRVIAHGTNRGIGQALLSGYGIARYENVVAVPADGQFNCEELLAFSEISERSVVSFFRRRRNGYSSFRRALSGANQWVNRLGLGIKVKDVNWVKAYKREAVANLPLRFQSSLVESEICAKLLHQGFQLVEVESAYLPRSAGTSRAANLRSLIRVARDSMALYREVREFKRACRGPSFLKPAESV